MGVTRYDVVRKWDARTRDRFEARGLSMKLARLRWPAEVFARIKQASDMRVHSDAHHACSCAWRLCDTAIWKAIPENYA
jgi:hypothetical protein